MKISAKFLALLLSTLALSGCATSSCKKNAVETPAPVKVVAAKTVVAPVTPKAAPAASEPVEEKIPAAVLK